jgi:hypothetical protein
MNSQQGPEPNISKAVRVLMDASPEFRAALEKTAQKLAEAMEVLDTPEMREALRNAGAKVAEFDQATKRIANGDDEPPALEAS